MYGSYVRHVAATPSVFHAPLGGIGVEAYAAALANLRSEHFSAFRLTRDLVSASRILSSWPIGWEPLGALAADAALTGSRQENSHGAHYMSSSQRAFFRELNVWDIKLFDALAGV